MIRRGNSQRFVASILAQSLTPHLGRDVAHVGPSPGPVRQPDNVRVRDHRKTAPNREEKGDECPAKRYSLVEATILVNCGGGVGVGGGRGSSWCVN